MFFFMHITCFSLYLQRFYLKLSKLYLHNFDSSTKTDTNMDIAEAPAGLQSNTGTSLAKTDQEKLEIIKILKSKIEANIAAMPLVLRRMNE